MAQSDPWAEAAKAYKPQGGTAPSTSNDDWRVWQTGKDDSDDGNVAQQYLDQSTAPTTETKAIPKALDNFGRGAAGAFVTPVSHPWETAKGMAKAATPDPGWKGAVESVFGPAGPMAYHTGQGLYQDYKQNGLAHALGSVAGGLMVGEALEPVATVAGKGIAKTIGKTVKATGRGAEMAAATGESAKLAGTRMLAKGTPGQLLQSALKPSASYGANASSMLEQTLPDVIAANPKMKGVSGFAKAADTAASARGKTYQNWLEPNKTRPVDMSSVVSAQNKSVPLIARTESPGIVSATDKVAQQYLPKLAQTNTVTSPLVDPYGAPITREVTIPGEPERTLGFADQIRQDSNQKLHSLYAKTGGDRYAALANPETARTYALNNEVRDTTYKGLSDATGVPEEQIRANQDQHGRLIDAADIANKREPIFARHDPVNLGQTLAASHGGPLSTAFNWAKSAAIKNLTNSDALVNSAVDRYQNPKQTPLVPRTNVIPRVVFAGGKGFEHLGGAIDNSANGMVLKPYVFGRRDQQ